MKYSDWPESKKERSRQASRKWASKNSRDNYYKEYESHRPHENQLLRASRCRSKKLGIPHNIDTYDIIITDNCPICNKPMIKSKNPGGTSESPTLDKIIPELGYVKGNVAVICKLCNSTKGSGSAELHRKIADYMDSYI